jgi:hypothetical protein
MPTPRLAVIESCHEGPRRAGWSIGEVGTSSRWLVTETKGEKVIITVGTRLAAA